MGTRASRPAGVVMGGSAGNGALGFGTAHAQRGGDGAEVDRGGDGRGDAAGEPEREQHDQPREVPPRGGLGGDGRRPAADRAGERHVRRSIGAPATQPARSPLQAGEAPGHPARGEEYGAAELGDGQTATAAVAARLHSSPAAPATRPVSR